MKKIIDFRTGEQINIIDEFELDITERVKIEKVR